MTIFATFRAQPFGLISSAGTGRVDRVNATIDAKAYFDLSNSFSLSGTSQDEPYCNGSSVFSEHPLICKSGTA